MHDESGTSTFTFRPFDPAHDFPALVALINAIDAVDQSGEATSEEQQRAQVAWPGRDLPCDRWLTTSVADPDQLLGFGDSWKMPTTDRADIYVGMHPAWRRHGLGRELLRRTLAGLQRLREHGQREVVIESFSEPTLAITSYQELGFAIRRHSIAYQHTIA